MSILDKLEPRRTGNVKPGRTSVFSTKVEETGVRESDSFSAKEEWVLTGWIHVTFWANRAQFESAKREAENVLVWKLYGDILAEIPELRIAIMNDDRAAAMAACGRIESLIKGGL